MKRNKIFVAGLAILLMAGFALSQEAGMGPGPRHHGGVAGGHELAFFTKALDLTDAQQAQIKKLIARKTDSSSADGSGRTSPRADDAVD